MIGREPVLGTYLSLSLSFLCFQHCMLCFSCAWWTIHSIRWSSKHRFNILLDYHTQPHSAFSLIVNVLSIFASSFHFGKMGIHQQTETTTILCYFHLRGYQLHAAFRSVWSITIGKTWKVSSWGWLMPIPTPKYRWWYTGEMWLLPISGYVSRISCFIRFLESDLCIRD